MAYNLEDLYQSLNDIYYQVDEGTMSLGSGEDLALKCCNEFVRTMHVKQWKKEHINE